MTLIYWKQLPTENVANCNTFTLQCMKESSLVMKTHKQLAITTDY